MCWQEENVTTNSIRQRFSYQMSPMTYMKDAKVSNFSLRLCFILLVCSRNLKFCEENWICKQKIFGAVSKISATRRQDRTTRGRQDRTTSGQDTLQSEHVFISRSWRFLGSSKFLCEFQISHSKYCKTDFYIYKTDLIKSL